MDHPPAMLRGEGIGIHQRRKLVELHNEYTLTDASGQVVGHASQQRQPAGVRAVRLFGDLDVVLPVELDVHDVRGDKVLQIDKPAMTWRCHVLTRDGEVGTVTKRMRLGRARFLLADATGAAAGEVHAGSWRARDFDVLAPDGRSVATVTKRWRGLLTEAFTDADSYAVTFVSDATALQRTLGFASALAVDLVMKQTSRS